MEREFRLEHSLREKEDYLLRRFNTSGNFSLEQVGPGAQARRKHVPINLKSHKSLFEPIECGLSVLNHLIRMVRHRNKDRSHDCIAPCTDRSLSA